MDMKPNSKGIKFINSKDLELNKRKLNKEESNALHLKEMQTHKKVLCPRCGAELKFEIIGVSYRVYCPTKNCIEMNVRGI